MSLVFPLSRYRVSDLTFTLRICACLSLFTAS